MLKALGVVLGQLYARVRDRNVRVLLYLAIAFVAMVVLFTVVFHVIMEREGQSFTWISAVYWTIVTMTTLGFGDIVFASDLGRVFSVVVLLTGSTFLLAVLPFVFVQFVFLPWMDARQARRSPRSVPASVSGHVVLTEHGPVEQALIKRAEQAELPYVLIVDDPLEAARLHDQGVKVMVGEFDDAATYEHARVSAATLVVATRNDRANTNIAFTVRERVSAVDPDDPDAWPAGQRPAFIVASANSPAAVDILELAGADVVVQLGEILGAAMAARTLGPDGRSHVIGSFAGLRIAEASAAGTSLVGLTLQEAQLRARLGVGLIGVWDRGRFEIATGRTQLHESSVIILAATSEQLEAYDREYAFDSGDDHPMVVIGGGRVGRAVGRAFEQEGLAYSIIEQLPERVRPGPRYVVGDAAERSVLEEAGIADAGAVVLTTHDDDVNVYLTLYCRRLRPDIRIVARAKLDRNVPTLYRAGADAVLSYAATCSAAIWNQFRGNETLLIADGLNIFRTPVPPKLVGKTLAEAHIYTSTGCNVVAVEHAGRIHGNPDAHSPLPAGGELVMIGDEGAEAEFAKRFPGGRRRAARR
ncbi:MAG: NAD-binding protein [Ilumatobacteraceae bacterium]